MCANLHVPCHESDCGFKHAGGGACVSAGRLSPRADRRRPVEADEDLAPVQRRSLPALCLRSKGYGRGCWPGLHAHVPEPLGRAEETTYCRNNKKMDEPTQRDGHCCVLAPLGQVVLWLG